MKNGKKALLVWEFGAGFGHAYRLGLIGRRLARLGMAVRYGFRDLDAARISGIDAESLFETPRWPAPDPSAFSPEQLQKEATRTLGQVLGYAGFANRDSVLHVAKEWERLLAEEKPDIVIADFAPSAVLAVKGRVPVLVVGEGYIVPPRTAPGFLPFHVWTSRDLLAEAALLENVNAAQRSLGRQQLDRFVAAMQGQRNLVCSWRQLDPLRRHRVEPQIGFVAENIPAPARGAKSGTFAYLHREALNSAPVLAVLPKLPRPVFLCAPSIAADAARHLEDAGISVVRRFVDLAQAIPHCRLVVHQSGVGVASMAMAAGVPQLAITLHIENVLTGHALQMAGVGAAFPLAMVRHAEMLDAAHRLATDPGVADAAMREAEAIASEHPVPAIDSVAAAALGFVNSRRIDL